MNLINNFKYVGFMITELWLTVIVGCTIVFSRVFSYLLYFLCKSFLSLKMISSLKAEVMLSSTVISLTC